MPITFNKVDLPDPEGPMMEMNSPSFTCRLISFKIKFGLPLMLIHFEIFFNSIIFVVYKVCNYKVSNYLQMLLFLFLQSSFFLTGTNRSFPFSLRSQALHRVRHRRSDRLETDRYQGDQY